RPTGVCGG
ncbi:tail length tape measure family protein, partial [Escherichia coli 93.0055]